MISTAAALHYLGPELQVPHDFLAARRHPATAICWARFSSSGEAIPTSPGGSTTTTRSRFSTSGPQGLRQAGILRVTGDLMLNASSFDEEYRHPDWPPERDSRWYQAPDLGPVLQRQRRRRVGRARGASGRAGERDDRSRHRRRSGVTRARTVGKAGKVRIAVSRPSGSDLVTVSGTVPQPVLPLGRRRSRSTIRRSSSERRSKSRLRAAGIELTGSVVERAVPADNAWILVATTESDIVPTLAIANKRSQSFYAEQIFKTLAYEKTGQRELGGRARRSRSSSSRGLGLDAARFELRDGSGLSSGNRVSAADLVRFLRAMNRHPQGAVWRSTLAVSGDAGGLPPRTACSTAGAGGSRRPRPAP